MSGGFPRYALYFAPSPESALWRFGSSALGYDAVTGLDLPVPAFAREHAARWPSLTAEPRKYGFHATLKAPFDLADGIGEAELYDEVTAFARRTATARIDGLAVTAIGSFVALTPLGDTNELNQLASNIVDHFDRFRTPLSAQDRERRLQSPLTTRQITHLDRYGYPYVHADFHFHMTLTNALHEEDRVAMRLCLEDAFQSEVSNGVKAIDRLCLFRQETQSSRFRIILHADLA